VCRYKKRLYTHQFIMDDTVKQIMFLESVKGDYSVETITASFHGNYVTYFRQFSQLVYCVTGSGKNTMTILVNIDTIAGQLGVTSGEMLKFFTKQLGTSCDENQIRGRFSAKELAEVFYSFLELLVS
jgi:hypothetical protein